MAAESIVRNMETRNSRNSLLTFATVAALGLAWLATPPEARAQAAVEYGGAAGVSASTVASKPQVFNPGGPDHPNMSLFLSTPKGTPPEVINRDWFQKVAGKNGGQLTITAVPAHSRVWVDDKYVGEAPVKLTLPVGKHKVNLQGPRQESATRDLTVESGKDQKLAIKLKETYPTAVTIPVFGQPH